MTAPESTVILAGALAAGLAVIHLFAGKLRFLNVTPRSRWLSAASGVSVAYVFVHVLPDLASSQESLRQATQLPFLEYHVYLLALVGMLTFYGLDRLAKRSRAASTHKGGEDVTSPGVFWIHAVSYSLYNGLIGYLLLHREVPGRLSLILFASAMATHFVVNDYGLRRDHKYRYRHYGRWIISAMVLLGWAIGAVAEIHKAAVAALFGFLAGGVILNVLKEELPEEQESSFGAFVTSAIAYTLILLTI